MNENTVDTDIVELLRWLANSAKPMDANAMRLAASEIERVFHRQKVRWADDVPRLRPSGLRRQTIQEGSRSFFGGGRQRLPLFVCIAAEHAGSAAAQPSAASAGSLA